MAPSYSNNYWLEVMFLSSNPNYGWVCGFNGMVIRTTDAGNSWQGVSINGAYHLEGICFTSTTTGYTSGVEGIWKSTNGGANWFSVKPAYAGDSINLWGCYFLDDNNGMVIGEGCGGSMQYFFRTTDGGGTWTYFTGTEPNSGLTDVIMYPGGICFATSSGKLWHSSDGGFNWSVMATSGSNLWQEDLSMNGNSILVPYAGDNCQGGGSNGGMRFSTNDGANWNDFNTGIPIFGSFLISATEGWACGYFRSIYHTTDAGRTWELKNCGISTANLDDIYFIDANTGWVVGEGIYRYAPPKHSISKTLMNFGEICRNIPRLDTLWVRNFNFNSVSGSYTMQGPNPGDFSIIEPTSSNFNINACDSARFIVRYFPLSAGNRSASLKIIINGFTDYTVNLTGSSLVPTSRPLDTLIVDTVKCGATSIKSVIWKSDNVSEYINSIDRTGSDQASTNVILPLNISTAGTKIDFILAPTDTGWSVSRFRFRLIPCPLDSSVTVKVYGISPIINAQTKYDIQGECQNSVSFEIPFINTGNVDLIISNLQFMPASNGFTINGWKSGSPLTSVIAPKKSDTLKITFSPGKSGLFTTKLRVTNNDGTKVRGIKNPFDIDLSGFLNYSKIDSHDTIIDMGSICVGDSSKKSVKIWNSGNLPLTLDKASNSLSVFTFVPRVSIFPIQIKQNDTLISDIVFKPKQIGTYLDTILIKANPCDQIQRIVVKGKGIKSSMTSDPTFLSGTIYNHKTANANVKVTNTGTEPIEITGFKLNPVSPDWVITFSPTLPQTINPGEFIDFTVFFTSDTEVTLSANICFETKSVCNVDLCIPVVYQSKYQEISVQPTNIIYDPVKCLKSSATDTVFVKNLSNINTLLDSIWIDPDNVGFRILNAVNLPYNLQVNEELKLLVEFNPLVEGVSNSSLFVSNNGQTTKVDLTGSYFHTDTFLSDSVYSFGTFESCESAIPKKFKIYNNGNIDDNITINSDTSTACFFPFPKQDIIVGSKDSAEILVTFIPALASEGRNSVRFNLVSKICNTNLSIDVDGYIYRPRLSLNPDSIQFLNVWVDDTLTKTLNIKNNSNNDLIIENLNISNSLNTIETLISAPPIPLQTGSAKDIPVRFIARRTGTYFDTLHITYSSKCDYDTLIIIKSVVPAENYKVNLKIPDYIVSPYDLVEVNVVLTEKVPKFIADSLKISISFDSWLFSPGTAELTLPSGKYPIDLVKSPGKFDLTVTKPHISTFFADSGTKIIIYGATFPSFPTYTKLKFERAEVFTGKQFTLTTDDGSIDVTPVCKPIAGMHLIMIPKFKVLDLGRVFTGNDISFGIESSDAQSLTYKMYNAEGIFVHSGNLELKSGTNSIDLMIPDISSGLYAIRFLSSFGKYQNEKFIILK